MPAARPLFHASHARLDAAVLNAYDWPHDVSDEDLLARLLALYLEREPVRGAGEANGGQGVEPGEPE